MVSSLLLFRHGALDTKENIFCGWLDIHLNKKGIKEAKILARKMRKEKIDFAFCSDHLRSKQCLVEVLKYHKKAKVIVDHRLRERHYGALTGHSKLMAKVMLEEHFQKIHRGYHTNIPSGESFNQVSKRVFAFMNELLRFMQKNNCSVAISAHSASSRLIQQYLEGLLVKEAEKLEHHPEKYKKYLITFIE